MCAVLTAEKWLLDSIPANFDGCVKLVSQPE